MSLEDQETRPNLAVQLVNEGLPIEVVMERAGVGEEETTILLLAAFTMVVAALNIIHHLPRKRRRKRGPPDVPG
jgi:hypothetical protein